MVDQKDRVLARVNAEFRMFEQEYPDMIFSEVEEEGLDVRAGEWISILSTISPHSKNGATRIGFTWTEDIGHVFNVYPQSLAERAGIRVDDFLTGINRFVFEDVENPAAFSIGKCGETIAVKAFRPITVESVDFTPNALGLNNFFGVGSVVGDYEVEITRQP